MSYEQRDNSGTLFKNDRKESDKHPDYNGTALIDGTEYYMSAWLKTGKSGTKFMSFAFKPKKQSRPAPRQEPSRRHPQQEPPQRPASRYEELDDEIPF